MSGEWFDPAEELTLVTGANGFVGARVVSNLLNRGAVRLRCFVRPSSRLDRLEDVLRQSKQGASVELVRGDLTSRQDCVRAADGVSIILHLAAGFDKSFAGAFMNSALTTRNLMDAFLQNGFAKRFVNVSSFAVYSTRHLMKGDVVDESCPLEDEPQERYDAYGFGKLSQERLVREYGETRGLPYVILRPGAVFGPGKRDLSGRVGIDTFGVFINIGGSNVVPLTFVDNCAEAIVLAGLASGIDGEVFNIVDDELITSRQFLRAYKTRVGMRSIWIPYTVAYGLSWLWEVYARRSKGQLPPAFNRRRCVAEWRLQRFSNRKLHERLGWQPRIGSEEAMRLFLGQFEPRMS
jgi:nucleoside-diphosphate-sugar epimerase